MVRLKNGEEMPEELVIAVMNSIKELQSLPGVKGITVPYDLVRVCRDRNFVIKNSEDLQSLTSVGLVKGVDGSGRAVVEEAVRSIVTAAATGDSLDYKIQSPLA